MNIAQELVIAVYIVAAIIVALTIIFCIVSKRQEKRWNEIRSGKVREAFAYMDSIKKEWAGSLRVDDGERKLVFVNGDTVIVIRYDVRNYAYYGQVYERNPVYMDWDFNAKSILTIATIIKFYSNH